MRILILRQICIGNSNTYSSSSAFFLLYRFLGTPFFNSMVARAQVSSSDISVLVDPEIFLFPDFISTLRIAHKLDHDWFLFASSQDTPYLENLQKSFCSKRMLMAWNNGDLPLHKGVLPPFLYGKGLHNDWIVTEALSSDYRFVFDASLSISNIYVKEEASNDTTATDLEKRNWEFAGNSLLGMIYGSFHFHKANYSDLFKFLKCGGQYLFANTVHNIVYSLGNQMSFRLRSKSLPNTSIKERDILNCIDSIKSLENRTKNCSPENKLQQIQPVSLPLSFEDLLDLRADQDKTIVLAVAGYSYKDMLMSWVCRLRQLQVSNFLVGAIDNEIYEFSVLQVIIQSLMIVVS